jgi:hypothetical protein
MKAPRTDLAAVPAFIEAPGYLRGAKDFDDRIVTRLRGSLNKVKPKETLC